MKGRILYHAAREEKRGKDGAYDFSSREHTTGMNTRKNKDKDPIDTMIQGNKEEADSMLSLWGLKRRAHLKTKKIKK